jgi:ribosomal protein L37AE/L43A
MVPIPRVARAPLTSKQPEACPHCGGRNLTRRGTRRKKLGIVQLWRCASCKRTFTPGPAALPLSPHRLRSRLLPRGDRTPLKKRTNRNVSPSTIAAWLQEYKQHCTYRRLRPKALPRFPATQTIRSIKFYHRQVYSFAYHRAKLDFLRRAILDDKRTGDTRFAGVADFLESIPSTCPHELFTRDEGPKARASQARPEFADSSRIIVSRKENAATGRAHHPGGRKQQAPP